MKASKTDPGGLRKTDCGPHRQTDRRTDKHYETTTDKMNNEENDCDCSSGDCERKGKKREMNWYIVEVDIDGRYYGKFATYATCEQNAQDIIAESDLGARNYDTITLAGFLYEGDALNDADTNQFHEIE